MTGSPASCGAFVPPCPAGRDVQRPPVPFAAGGVLNGLIHVVLGQAPPKEPFCSLILVLVDLDAAAFIFLAISAHVLGVNLYVDVDLTLLPSCCGRKAPKGS
ncbi:hypothetical protein CFC21_112748 [Triticum aestivum]|uniref:Hydrophobic seed protein domain-containing protein n=2 Tax=Triticum aestivum TaxID=4565 RepID=A0A3B6HP16_WHEAT|nr:hypothetical protein [Triticum aestivum]